MVCISLPSLSEYQIKYRNSVFLGFKPQKHWDSNIKSHLPFHYFQVNINNLLLKHLHNCKIFNTTVYKTGGGGVCSADGNGLKFASPTPDPGGSGRYLPLKFLNNSTTARSLPLPPPSPRPAAAGCAALAARARVGNGLKLRPSVDRRALCSARNNTTVGDCKPGESEVGWYRK